MSDVKTKFKEGDYTMIHNKKQIVCSVLLGFFILSTVGCQSLKVHPVEEEAYILERRIIYGKGGDDKLRLELARPARGWQS